MGKIQKSQISKEISVKLGRTFFVIILIDCLAEWLRRETRNLLGVARAGSNPAAVVFFLFFNLLKFF